MGNMMNGMQNGGEGSPLAANGNAPKKIICKNCNSVVPEGMKFCGCCGTKVEEEKAKCASCGAELIPGMKFCGACGSPIAPVKRVCKECGLEIPEGMAFCGGCGTKYEG